MVTNALWEAGGSEAAVECRVELHEGVSEPSIVGQLRPAHTRTHTHTHVLT